MDPIWLEPFLRALETKGLRAGAADHLRIQRALAQGGQWSLERLRLTLRALLAHDPKEIQQFDEVFDAFFDRALPEAPLPPEPALETLRQALKTLAPAPIDAPARPASTPVRWVPPEEEPPPTSEAPAGLSAPPKPRRRSLRWLLALVLVISAGAMWYVNRPPPVEDQKPPPAPATPTAPTDTPPPETAPQTLPVATLEPGRLERLGDITADRPSWRAFLPAGVSAISLFVLLGHLILSLRVNGTPRPPTSTRRSFKDVLTVPPGQAPAPWFTATAQDRLVDAIGYHLSEQGSSEVDVPASIRATCEADGVPEVRLQPRRHAREVLLILDDHAPALTWCPAARELETGLRRRGIPTRVAWLTRVAGRLRLEDGSVLQVDVLEADADAWLVLVLGEADVLAGDRAGPTAHRLLMRRIARLPHAAWLELRDPRRWYDLSAVAELGCPFFPATSEGLEGVADWLHAHGRGGGDVPDLRSRQICPREAGPDMALFLGDALPWAAACALFNPMPLEVALWLREKLELLRTTPVQRLERILSLPGCRVERRRFWFDPRVQDWLVDELGSRSTALLKAVADALRTCAPEAPSEASADLELARVAIQLTACTAALQDPRADAGDRKKCLRDIEVLLPAMAGLKQAGVQPRRIETLATRLRQVLRRSAGPNPGPEHRRVEALVGPPPDQAPPAGAPPGGKPPLPPPPGPGLNLREKCYLAAQGAALVLCLVLPGLRPDREPVTTLELKLEPGAAIPSDSWGLVQLYRETSSSPPAPGEDLPPCPGPACTPIGAPVDLFARWEGGRWRDWTDDDAGRTIPLLEAASPGVYRLVWRLPWTTGEQRVTLEPGRYRQTLAGAAGEVACREVVPLADARVTITRACGLEQPGWVTRAALATGRQQSRWSIGAAVRREGDTHGATMAATGAAFGRQVTQVGSVDEWLDIELTAGSPFEGSVDRFQDWLARQTNELLRDSQVLVMVYNTDAAMAAFQSVMSALTKLPNHRILIQGAGPDLTAVRGRWMSATGTGSTPWWTSPLEGLLAASPGQAAQMVSVRQLETRIPAEHRHLSREWATAADDVWLVQYERVIEPTPTPTPSPPCSAPPAAWFATDVKTLDGARPVDRLPVTKIDVFGSSGQSDSLHRGEDDGCLAWADADTVDVRKSLGKCFIPDLLLTPRQPWVLIQCEVIPQPGSVRTGLTLRAQVRIDQLFPRRARAPSGLVPLVSIQGGEFDMGAEDINDYTKPVHHVTVPSFQMGRTEVTNAQYRACIDAGSCTIPDWENCTRYVSKDISAFQRDKQPVVCVDWEQARTFAKWVGGGLPSEAQWEYAARGPEHKAKYPWGNPQPDCNRVIFDAGGGNGCGTDATWEVCSKRAGNTPEGLCDMAGNVWEWVEDCWHASYVDAPSDVVTWSTNCQDALGRKDSSGSVRVIRGASWFYVASRLRASNRYWSGSAGRYVDVGFRVVVPAPARSRGETQPP